MDPQIGRDRGDDQPRPVVETLPRFQIQTLARWHRKGCDALFWYGEAGQFLGCGTVVECGPERLLLRCILNERTYIRSANEDFAAQLVISERGGFGQYSAKCPICEKSVSVLLKWEATWACGYCHDVINIRNILSKNQKLYYDYLSLMVEGGWVRRRGESFKSHLRRVAKLDVLEGQVRLHPPPTLPALVDERVHTRFFPLSEAPDWEDPEPD